MAIITLIELKSYLGSKSINFEDSDLEFIIEDVNSEIQQELNVDVFREPLLHINKTRQNLINGSNKTFYIKNYIDKWFADKNGDGSVTVADMIIYSVDSDGITTNPTISSLNNNDRSITLETAPENVKLYFDYSYSFYDMLTPDKRIKKLAKYLALSYSYFELELDLIGTSIKMGNISYSGVNTNSKTAKYKNKYLALLKDLKVYGTSKNKPVNFKIAQYANYRPDKTYGYRNYNPIGSEGGF